VLKIGGVDFEWSVWGGFFVSYELFPTAGHVLELFHFLFLSLPPSYCTKK
jgi:hypothetical protein